MKFRYPPSKAVFEVTMNVPQVEAVHGMGFNDVETVRSVRVDPEGITLTTATDLKYHFLPDIWGEYWGTKPSVEGKAACAAWEKYQAFVLDRNADALLSQVEAGETTFFEAREEWPELFEHPLVQAALSKAFRDDAIEKPGKRPKVDESIWQLYEWASFYYLRGKEASWEGACDLACVDHPELVPPTWSKGDPGGNLKRQASRVLDRNYKRSQDRSRPRDK